MNEGLRLIEEETHGGLKINLVKNVRLVVGIILLFLLVLALRPIYSIRSHAHRQQLQPHFRHVRTHAERLWEQKKLR